MKAFGKSSAATLAAASLCLTAASLLAPAALAQPPAKATIDAAKAQGAVGEQADGFLGVVGGGDPGVRAAVDEINAGRARAYRDAATRTGATPEAAGQATARQLEAHLPPGQFFRTADGRWERR